MRVAVNGRALRVSARGPRGLYAATRSLSCCTRVLRSSSRRFHVETRKFQLAPTSGTNAPLILSLGRYFSTESTPDYRTQLQLARHDAQVARLVFEDIRQGGGTQLSTFTASSIFETLAMTDAVDDALEVLQYAQTKRVQLDSDAFTRAFKKWYPAAQYLAVLRVWDSIKAGGGYTKQALFLTTLLSAVQLKESARAFQVLDVMKTKGLTTGDVYAHVLGVACRTKQHELIGAIFDYMHEDKLSGQDMLVPYHNTLRLAFKEGERAFVLELLSQMGKRGVDPREEYTNYLLSLHKRKSYNLVLEAFEFMENEGYAGDEVTVGAAAEAAVRMDKHELLFQILDGTKEHAEMAKVASAVFPRVVRATLWKNQHQLALKIFDYMQSAGVDPTLAYTSAVRVAFKAEQHYFVTQILDKMVECGLDASEEYSHAIMSFRTAKRYDYILHTFKAMRDLGYYQEEILHSVAVMAAVKLDMKDAVFEICDGATGEGVDSKRLYSYALEEALAAKNQDLVDSITSYTSTTFANVPVEREMPPVIETNRKCSLSKLDVCKNALLEAHADKKSVAQILDSMLANCEDSSDRSYLHVLRGANKAKQHELVVAILDHMKKNGVALSIDMCTVILRSCARVSDLEAAFGVRRSMRDSELAMTHDTAQSLIKCTAKAGRWDTAVDIMSELRSSGLQLPMAVYTMALNECEKQNDLKVAAASIYDVMPIEYRTQLSGRSLRQVLLGHATSSTKELQRRGHVIASEHGGKSSAKLYDQMLDIYATKTTTISASNSTPTSKSVHDTGNDSPSEAVNAPSKGILGFFSSFFTR